MAPEQPSKLGATQGDGPGASGQALICRAGNSTPARV